MPDRTWRSYATAEAFRDALKDRLGSEARERGIPVNRLRKEAAFHRLLARFVALGPSPWALKGAFAMIARLGRHVRGTRDVDANWRDNVDKLDDLLARIEEVDLDDWFRFEFGEPQQMEGEIRGQVARRYPVTCYVGPREFERVRLDVNFVGEDDPRPVERAVVRRNPFLFVGAAPLEVPMITPSHQLAEKLHAYVRAYPDGRSSRPKDLYDSLLIVDGVQLPRAGEVVAAARQTFSLRDTSWPPTLTPPPSEWGSEWAVLLSESDEPLMADLTLEAAFELWRGFWDPLMRADVADDALWSTARWTWVDVLAGGIG